LEKWEILNTVYEGVNYETCVLLEHWNLCVRNVDKAWNFLDWLAQDTYECESSCSNSYIPPPCVPNHASIVCAICHCSDHDSNFCACYISADDLARLTSMTKTMNEQQIEFANNIKEHGLSHETDLRFSSLILDVDLWYDGVSFLTLNPN